LATQARKVFYLPDTGFGKNWQVVQTFEHNHLYNVSQTEVVQYNGPAYQQDDCCEDERMQKSVSNSIYDKPLNRDDEQAPIFEVAEIARLLTLEKKKCMIVKVRMKMKMRHFFNTEVKMKEVPQLRLTVMMNSYVQLKLHCNFPFCDDL
jgi:hypothetical protein